jgi:hypothetical protein
MNYNGMKKIAYTTSSHNSPKSNTFFKCLVITILPFLKNIGSAFGENPTVSS